MDTSNILQAVQLCVKAQNQKEIQDGQAYLERVSIEPEYPLKLMMIVDQSDLDINIRQFAVTELKNSIKKFWKAKKQQPSFSDSDKAAVKNNVLDAIIRSVDNTKLSKMYCKIIYDICAYDFPESWPNFVQDAVNKMNSSEIPNVIYGSLLALQQVFSNLQFDTNTISKFEGVIPIVFPSFQNLISKLMGIYNQDNAYILKPILKCFYFSINLQLPKSLHNYETLSSWINFLKLLLDSEMPKELTAPTQNEETITIRDKHPLWKNKKWAGRILNKFIMRYANLEITPEADMKVLARWLIQNHLPGITESQIKQLLLSQSMFIGSATIHFSIKYIQKAIRIENLFLIIKPQIETILYDILFPHLFLTRKDDELWNSDPSEFIRQEDDFINPGMRNHKNLATDLIRTICSKDQSYLHLFIQFLVSIMNSGVNPRNNQQLTLAMKDGIFFAIGQLKDQILKDSVLKTQIETLLEKYVIPEFKSTNPFIRSRTCWIIGKYGNIKLSNEQIIVKSVEGITSCMKDENLPVKFKAALALDTILQQPQAQEMIRGYLSEILKIYLKLMEEVDSEELVSALEGIVDGFKNDIVPFAYDLCVHLSAAFYKLCSKDADGENEEDNGECQLAAGGCLRAIGKIVASPVTQQFLTQVEQIIIPILNTTLIDDQFDFMEEALYLLQQLTFKSQTLPSSSQLWFYYPVLIYIVIGKENADLSVTNSLNDEQKVLIENSVSGWGPEHLNEIMCILMNFIQKGKEFFFTARDLFGTSFIDLLFYCISQMYKKCKDNYYKDYQEEESYMKNVITAFYCLIENSVQDQKISGPILKGIIQQTLSNLNLSKMKNDVLVANLETLCLCFYYNANETFQILYAICGPQIVQALFERWFLLIKHFKQDFAKQRLLLAFSSILSCQLLPDEIKLILPSILKHCVTLTTEILEIRKENEFEDVDDDEDEDGDAKDLDNNLGQVLANQLQKIQQNQENRVENEEEDDEDDDCDDDDYDPFEKFSYNYNYDCPLENIDEIIVLEQKLLSIVHGNPQLYQYISKDLTNEDKQTLETNITASKKQYEEYLKEKEKEATTQ